MSSMSLKKEYSLPINTVIEKLEGALKEVGFGILTRIDFDQKIKEKLNEIIPKTVVLGACNPKLVFEVYKQNKDVTLLIPCNVVVTETKPGNSLVEIIRPSQMMNFLSGITVQDLIKKAESDLEKVLQELK